MSLKVDFTESEFCVQLSYLGGENKKISISDGRLSVDVKLKCRCRGFKVYEYEKKTIGMQGVGLEAKFAQESKFR